MLRSSKLALAVLGIAGATLAGCASSDPRVEARAAAAAEYQRRQVTLDGGDSVGRMLVRSSPALASGRLTHEVDIATVPDTDTSRTGE